MQQFVAQVRDAVVLAVLVNAALVTGPQVGANLLLERFVGDLDLLPPVHPLDGLFGAEREQEAQYDDADFLEKLAQGADGVLRSVNVHGQR